MTAKRTAKKKAIAKPETDKALVKQREAILAAAEQSLDKSAEYQEARESLSSATLTLKGALMAALFSDYDTDTGALSNGGVIHEPGRRMVEDLLLERGKTDGTDAGMTIFHRTRVTITKIEPKLSISTTRNKDRKDRPLVRVTITKRPTEAPKAATMATARKLLTKWAARIDLDELSVLSAAEPAVLRAALVEVLEAREKKAEVKDEAQRKSA